MTTQELPPYPMEEYIKKLQEQLSKQIDDSIREAFSKNYNLPKTHYLSYKLPLMDIPTAGNYNLTGIGDYDKTLNGLYGYYGIPFTHKSPSQFLVTASQTNSLEDCEKKKENDGG